MADRVRVDSAERDAAVAKLRNLVEELRGYINTDVNNTVQSMSSWWIGAAYEAFKNDFGTTKTVLEKQVLAELEDYINRLDKAVTAQIEQDTQNAGNIGIN